MMASSVQVLCPNGHRQTVKVNPNTKILQILEEVCMRKGFMPCEDYELRHGTGKKALDVTLSIRFANLVSNAKLELVKSQKSRAETTVVIALQLASGTRLQHSFSPSVCLWDILLHWENQPDSEHQGKLAVACDDQHPVCIYMRDEVVGEEALKATTLRKLGLTNGKAILRFLHRNVDTETLHEIKQKLAADKAKQDRLVARSLLAESMSSQTSSTPESSAQNETSRGLTSVEETPEGQGQSMASEELNTDTSPMETDSVSPARKQPRLDPEPMDEESNQGSCSAGQKTEKSDSLNGQEQNRHLDQLSEIPGVEVFRPGPPVFLSKEQQQMVDSLVEAVQPHIIQPTNSDCEQSSMSARPRCPRQQPAPFKFPETSSTSNQALNSHGREANKEDYAPCERESIVYSHDEPVEHDPEYDAEPSDEFFEVTTQDVKKMMADKVRQLNLLDDQPLMTKSMREALMDEKFSKYKRVVIRVQFPNRMVLQGIFRLKETVYSVEKFVKEHLEDKSMPFYLYTSPPKCVLKDKASTLIESNLAPATVLYFGSDSKKVGSYLSTAIVNECSSRLEADNIVLKSLPSESSSNSDASDTATSKKGGQPKRSKPEKVDYQSRDQSREGQGGEKKLPKWFAAGLKK